ncbi:hypothetical protein V2J09_018339 [Rumex salicifolius]
MAGKLPASTAQEIAGNKHGGVPDNFLHKDGYPQSDVASVPYMEDLVVDFSLLSPSSSSSPGAAEQELAKLHLALSTWGCFQAINHGITSSLLDEVRQVTKQYFILPLEEKRKCARSVEDWEGYGNDTIVSEHQTLDWNDRLYLKIHPEDQLKHNLWPINPPAFKETVQEYNKLLKDLFEILMKAVARSLNLDENCFLSQHGELVIMAGRFNFYPRCAKPQSVLGTKPHADGTTFTMLLQDKEVEGLQVLKDDVWFRVPSFPDALLINAGDLLEIMSNGVLKSPVHRVVTNSERERISLAMFCFPDPDREVGPVDELVTEDRPQLYKRVKHYEQIFFEYYQLGQRPLSGVKL